MFKCNICNKEYSSKSILNKHQKTTKKCLELKIESIKKQCKYCNYSTIKSDYFELHLTSCKLKDDNHKIKQQYDTIQMECSHLKNENCILIKNNKNIQNKNTKIKQHYLKYKQENQKLILDNQLHLNTIKMLENQVLVSHQFLQDNINTIISKPSIQQQENNLTNHNNQKIDLSLNLNSDFIQKNVDDNFTLHHLVNGIKGVATFTNDFIIHKENGQSKYICTDSSRAVFKYKMKMV